MNTFLLTSLQPLPKFECGEFWNLVLIQFTYLAHYAGVNLVLDALAFPWLQVSETVMECTRLDSQAGEGGGIPEE